MTVPCRSQIYANPSEKEEARSRDARRNEVMENIRRRKQQEIEELEQQRPRRSRFVCTRLIPNTNVR